MQDIKIINSSSNPLPSYATPGSAGLDIRAWLPDGPVTLSPLERRLIPTGLRIEMPQGWECQVRPRSGLAAKHGLTVLNSPGTVDSDYRGEIGVILVNLSPYPFTVESGERIAQLVFARCEQVRLSESSTLSPTLRGSGGFGHTGL